MPNAWRGEMDVTDRAALILAAGFGYGSGWTLDYTFTAATRWVRDPGGEGMGNVSAITDGLHFGRDTEALELAGRAIHHKAGKLPGWVKRLPDGERKAAMRWSAEHPLNGTGPHRVREFKHWKTNPRFVCVARVNDGRTQWATTASAALAMVPAPLAVILEVFALQRADRVPLLLRMLEASGADPAAARVAVVHWLYPARQARKVTMADAARAAGWRKESFCRAVRIVVERLDRWTRRASLNFLHAVNGNRTSLLHGVIREGAAHRHALHRPRAARVIAA